MYTPWIVIRSDRIQHTYLSHAGKYLWIVKKKQLKREFNALELYNFNDDKLRNLINRFFKGDVGCRAIMWHISHYNISNVFGQYPIKVYYGLCSLIK